MIHRVTLLLATALVALCPEATLAAESRSPVAHKPSFSREVLPILAHRCFECHAGTKRKGGLQLDSRELLLKGGDTGPAAIAGKSAQSELIRRVAGHVKADDEIMPPKGERLTAKEISLLRAWIDQGLEWDKLVRDVVKEVPVTLRPVKTPAGKGNPIDRVLAGYFAKHKVATRKPVDDRTFARRVYLDAIGLLPTPEQTQAFLDDRRADKREQLVRALLDDNEAYADHWITFWQDLLRDGKNDLGTTDVFLPVTPWLRRALVQNKPYDQFAAELINPAGLEAVLAERSETMKTSTSDDAGAAKKPYEAAGFVVGLMAGLEKPRGDQQWQVQAAQNVSQVFLGVQLKCATCHDSFIDHRTMKEAWGLASIYADTPLEMVRCELPTGKNAQPFFLFHELGQVEAAAPVAERRAQFASLVTSPKNGRFARTAVNRLWARLMGHGLVDPVDEMDREAWHPELLDWLAADFVEHGFDLKQTLARILTSRAYQAPAVDDEMGAGYVFRGPALRRLTAEQFVDAINALAGRSGRVWRENGSRLMEALGRPDRRTVATSRPSKASTLQAMELLNGADLQALLYGEEPGYRKLAQGKILNKEAASPKSEGADRVIPPPTYAPFAGLAGAARVEKLYQFALGRPPTGRERTVAVQLLAEAETAGGPAPLGDLVWLVVMLPEFQLIR